MGRTQQRRNAATRRTAQAARTRRDGAAQRHVAGIVLAGHRATRRQPEREERQERRRVQVVAGMEGAGGAGKIMAERPMAMRSSTNVWPSE